jgi:hypothetical protein
VARALIFAHHAVEPINIGFCAMRISKLCLATAREQIQPPLIAPVFIGDLAAYRNFVKELFSIYLVASSVARRFAK